MNKQENRLALSVLTTLTALIALVYTLILYHDIIFAVAGVSAIFLTTAYLLTKNMIAYITIRNKSANVQLKNMVDDLSSQLESMGSAQAQLGKATYLYTRQAAKAVTSLEDNYTQSQEALYRNLSSLSNAQNKATKLMIKYDQNNTMKLIATVKEIRNQLSETMVQGFDQIQPNNDEVVATLQTIVDYLKLQSSAMDQSMGAQLNNVARELQNISNSIQNVQIPVQTITQPFPAPPVMPSELATTKAVMPETVADTTQAPVPDMAMEPAFQTTIPEDLIQDPQTADTLTASDIENMTGIPQNSDIESLADIPQTSDIEDIADVAQDLNNENISNTMQAPVQEDIVEAAQDISAEQATPSEDANKMLSADEIAALFAAAEPAPDKIIDETEPEEEVPFTPTFTVVGKTTDPEPVVEEPAEEPAVNEDPNKMLSADEIAALFAAAEPAPKAKEPEPAVSVATESPAISDDPNKQLSPDEIAALFAAAEPAPKAEDPEPAAPAAKEITPVSDDPNKQLSPEEIAALFAQMG